MKNARIPNWNPCFVAKDGRKFNIRNIIWSMPSHEDAEDALCEFKATADTLPLGAAPRICLKIKLFENESYVVLLWEKSLPGTTYRTICTLVAQASGTRCAMSDVAHDLVEEAIEEWNAPGDFGFVLQDEQEFPHAQTLLFDSYRPGYW